MKDLFSDMSGRLIAGVDEVGRGPLAGDVVAAAVILGERYPKGITDSKKLTEKRREQLALEIRESSLCWALGRASAKEIDTLNILQASLLAMHRAVAALELQPDLVLVDGNRLPVWPYEARAIVGGDGLEPTIGAASILAKVQRDSECLAMESKYPGYGFAKHKGYPTREHLAALGLLGVTPEHRRSFGPVKQILAQQSLENGSGLG